MRTYAAADLALIRSSAFNWHARVFVQDQDGAMRDMRTLGGYDWLMAVSWSDEVSDFVQQGTVEFVSAINELSLAPLLETSPLNRNLAAAYSPFLRHGAEIQIHIAVTQQGLPVDAMATNWYPAFHGRIDEVGRADGATIRCTFRDMGGAVADAELYDAITFAADSLEDFLQAMLDSGLGPSAVTLYAPVATGITVTERTVEPGNLLDAMRMLAATPEYGGYELRYLLDEATNVYRLTLWLPNPDAAAMYTMGPGEYTAVRELRAAPDDLFNIGRVDWPDGVVQVASLASVALHGPRIARLDRRTWNITEAEAEDAATGLIQRVTSAPSEHQIETLLFPIVDVRDIIGWLAHPALYDMQQDWYVTGWEHAITRGGSARTTIRTVGDALVVPDLTEKWPTAYSAALPGPDNLLSYEPGWTNADIVTPATKQVDEKWLSRILLPGEAGEDVGGTLNVESQTVPTDRWEMFVRFVDAAGATISEVGDDDANAAAPTTRHIDADVPVPAGTERIVVGARSDAKAPYSGAPNAGTATLGDIVLRRTALLEPWPERYTLRTQTLRDAIIAFTGAEPLWSPPMMAERLLAWFDPRKSVLADGTAMATETDLSGFAHHGAQATGANRAAYKVNIINGYPALLFDGTNDYLAVDSLAALLSGDVSFSVFGVVRATNTSTQHNFFSAGNSATANSFHRMRLTDDVTTAVTRTNDAGTSVTSSLTVPSIINTNIVIGHAYNAAQQRGSQWRNLSHSALDVAMTVGAANFNQFSWGVLRRNGLQSYLTGYLAERIVILGAVPDQLARQIIRYLMQGWGIS